MQICVPDEPFKQLLLKTFQVVDEAERSSYSQPHLRPVHSQIVAKLLEKDVGLPQCQWTSQPSQRNLGRND